MEGERGTEGRGAEEEGRKEEKRECRVCETREVRREGEGRGMFVFSRAVLLRTFGFSFLFSFFLFFFSMRRPNNFSHARSQYK